jgi:hypothetical protein
MTIYIFQWEVIEGKQQSGIFNLRSAGIFFPISMTNAIYIGFFWWDWDLNSGLCVYKVGALLLEPHLQSISFWLFWKWGGGPSWTICPDWSWTLILLTSSSQVARIIGVNHQCLAKCILSWGINWIFMDNPLLRKEKPLVSFCSLHSLQGRTHALYIRNSNTELFCLYSYLCIKI